MLPGQDAGSAVTWLCRGLNEEKKMTPKGASNGAGAGMVHGRYRKREFADFFVSCQHFTTGATRLREPHGTQHLRRLAEDAACGVRARDLG